MSFRASNARAISKLREHDLLANGVIVVSAVGVLLLHNLYIAGGWVVILALLWLWTVLSRDNEQLRRDFADYPGPVGKPLAWVLSKLPGVAPKVLCAVLALGLCGFGIGVALSGGGSGSPGSGARRAAPDSRPRGELGGPLGRDALVARANSICADAAAKAHSIVATGAVPSRQHVGALAVVFAQETRDLRMLAATADVAHDWHVVLAGLAADTRRLAMLSANARSPSVERTRLSRTARNGHAAELRLGLFC